jgi:hypothetical protein
MTAVIETSAQTMWLDGEGIIQAISKPTDLTLDDAREAITKLADLFGAERHPIVVDLTGLKSMSRDARKYFAGPDTAKVQSAAALIIRSPMAKAIGNFFMGFDRALIPTRLCTSHEEALQWIRQFLP